MARAEVRPDKATLQICWNPIGRASSFSGREHRPVTLSVNPALSARVTTPSCPPASGSKNGLVSSDLAVLPFARGPPTSKQRRSPVPGDFTQQSLCWNYCCGLSTTQQNSAASILRRLTLKFALKSRGHRILNPARSRRGSVQAKAASRASGSR